MDLVPEERLSDSPYIERIWRSASGDDGGSFTSMAEIHSSIVVTRFQGRCTLTVRGPEIRATPAFSPPGAEFFGIMFKPGAFLPDIPPSMVMDRCDVNLPPAASRSAFWFNGSAWEMPNYENADTFIDWLVRDNLLVYDPLVSAVLAGQPVHMSLRTVQRRLLQATGLTHNNIYQIQRAREATTLLKQGVSILDVVEIAGYADQPHLTRALKHLAGQTPAQIVNQARQEKLSYLYTTLPY